MNPIPLKWRKYLLLRDFNLLPLDELEGNIRRYKKADREAVYTHIYEELCASPTSFFLFVVKLVPLDKGGQLPNLRISSIPDLGEFWMFFESHRNFNFSEIWCCRTRIDHDIFSVAGRILFSIDSGARFQVVEQVWRCSPRMIEAFYPMIFDWPFASAFRSGWGRSFKVERLYLPSGTINPATITDLDAEFRRSLLFLERARTRLELFTCHLEAYHSSYSVEYKLINDRLSFIDFDTPDDKTVLG